MLDGASYLVRVEGEDVSSREALRASAAALSRRAAARDDEVVGAVSVAGLTLAAGVGFGGSDSSVSLSSSELDSSDDDSSFLTTGLTGVWFRNRL